MVNEKKTARWGAALLSLVSLLLMTFFLMAMKKNPYIVPDDTLIKLRSSEDFIPGTLEGTWYNLQSRGLELAATEKGHEKKGLYITPVISPGFPVREMIPSWNIYCPADCGFSVELKVSKDGQRWSPWLDFGTWGNLAPEKKTITRHSWGAIKDDYFASDRGVSSLQLRFRFSSSGKGTTPSMSLCCLALSDQRGDLNRPLRSVPSQYCPPAQWKKQLNVPYRSQGAEDKSIAGEICSPTSVSMVMEYWGVKVPTAEFAKYIYDPVHRLYGMWWRGVQGAAQYGLEGWVQYFRNWETVREWIAEDQPVIACISFDSGALTGSMTPESEGHVIVIIGFDEKGNPICNDPAGTTESDGVVTYDAEELATAWFDKGGVGYIIRVPGE